MKTNYFLGFNNQTVFVLGEVLENNKIKLFNKNHQEIGVINAHKDDLDTIQREFLKIYKDPISEQEVTETVVEKTINPSDIIKGLESVIEKYPETKSRLASLKSQINNVFVKYNVLD